MNATTTPKSVGTVFVQRAAMIVTVVLAMVLPWVLALIYRPSGVANVACNPQYDANVPTSCECRLATTATCLGYHYFNLDRAL